jgi:anti-anti-sigma factor
MEQVNVLGTTNGVLEIALSGDIDLGNAETFYAEVNAAYSVAPADILFDCEGLNFIDSTTLGTFVKILKEVKANGHTLRLCNLQPKIKKLFLICSLDSLMEIA